MSRKDYRALADALGIDLREARYQGGRSVDLFWSIVGSVMASMKNDNGRFDRDKFVEAIEERADAR